MVPDQFVQVGKSFSEGDVLDRSSFWGNVEDLALEFAHSLLRDPVVIGVFRMAKLKDDAHIFQGLAVF